ncbi:MAG TPA: diaminopimelate epimerase [Sphingomonadaceae bacterium]|nr:diaminopimelate epimerase [Sphingomonadaceae bacterium]
MLTRFHKMHGLGNDFIVFDARDADIAMGPSRARALADRHTGVGCDQLIVLRPSPDADAEMRIYNRDGGEVEACGNAARCVAQLLGGAPTLSTRGGRLAAGVDAAGVTVELEPPKFAWDQIPLAQAMDTHAMPVGWDELERPAAVNVGNPHLVFFVADPDAVDLAKLGPRIEHDPLFPDRINVNVAGVRDGGISLRVWERGAGLTRACGTGACATAIAAVRAGLARSPVAVSLPGGDLVIDWSPGQAIRMTGSATHVFTGEIDLEAFG